MVQPAATPLGTEQNPVKLALAPTTETPKALAALEPLTKLLVAETGLRFKLSLPTSPAATIEAMGTNNVDVGWLEPLGYLAAHDRVGADPLLASVRHGSSTSSGQIVVRADSGITSLESLRGKRIAYVDDRSVSGYLMPRALLAAQGVDPNSFFGETIFAGSADAVVQAVAARKVAAGVIIGTDLPTPPAEPLRIIARTAAVPNDVLSLRKGIPPALGRKIADGLLRVAASPHGAKLLHDLYGIDGLAAVTDGAFEPVRAAVRLLDINLDEALAQRRPVPTP